MFQPPPFGWAPPFVFVPRMVAGAPTAVSGLVARTGRPAAAVGIGDALLGRASIAGARGVGPAYWLMLTARRSPVRLARTSTGPVGA